MAKDAKPKEPALQTPDRKAKGPAVAKAKPGKAADKGATKSRQGKGRGAARPGGPVVLRRALGACETGVAGVPRLLSAVREGPALRVFFGTGADPMVLARDGAAGCARPGDLRVALGGVMLVAEGPDALALEGGAQIALTPQPAEPAILAGKRCQIAFRGAETAAQLAEALAYHVRHHGLEGAVVVNRKPFAELAPPADSDALPAGEPGALRQPDTFAADLLMALGKTPVTVIVVDPELPLGQPDMGPESHLFLAPDAPGKDRMAKPAPDPWLSPLAEGLVYEALKWRFLTRARAVIALDACDVLAPRRKRDPGVFDLCESARRGVVLLVGQRIYPWRVRAGQPARLGDHICHQFDGRRGIARWGVAPAKAGLENIWRPARVSFAKPDEDGVASFYRAMALRVPGASPGELAPKSALIEDAGLIALSEGPLGHKPVRAPVSEPRAPDPATNGRTAIVTTMKNEAPFILEWLAYHRAIGVEDFLVYTNDCTDGTDTMLDLLQAKGIVQHRDNPYRDSGLKPQHAALQAAEAEPVMRECGWGICMDVDEFLCIKIGDGTLPALYAAMGEANMISATWRLFGNAEVHGYEDRFVTEQFTRCAPEMIRKPHQAWGFKTLFRNIDLYKKLGVHRPKGLRPDLWRDVRWLNGSGQPMPAEAFRTAWRSTTETVGYDWVQLNHYAVRSAESFLVKRDRGRVNHVDRDQGLNYWFRMNHNVAQDHAIARMIPAARAEYDRLMADPDIRAAHQAAVAAHRAKIAALLETETYRAFYAELTGARMEKLCRMQHHFGSAVFLAGPEVIPQDLHDRDLPPDFFFTIDAGKTDAG